MAFVVVTRRNAGVPVSDGRSNVLVLGIDPAPRKTTVVFDGLVFRTISATNLRTRIRELLPVEGPALVAWGAPVSFSHHGASANFWDRLVDHQAASWLLRHVGTVADKAVSVQPFSSCSHWCLSCHVLGLPFWDAGDRFHLAASPRDVVDPRCAIEVHPSMALAEWWVHCRIDSVLPRYKGSRSAAQFIVSQLSACLAASGARPPPTEEFLDDDHLDAWVAWRIGRDFLDGRAWWHGTPAEGGYVLPVRPTDSGCFVDAGVEAPSPVIETATAQSPQATKVVRRPRRT